jgi:Fe-S cluster biogenesis protein NfuA
MREAVLKELDETIIPLIRADGGDLELLEVTDAGVVRVRLKEACTGCPGAAFTIALVIEAHLKKAVPGFTRVEASFAYARPTRTGA